MTSEAEPRETAEPRRLSLTAAAAWAGVSQPTLRKYLQAGTLEAERVPGKNGPTWKIDPERVVAFVAERYSRTLDVATLPPEPTESTTQELAGTAQEEAESIARELAERLAAVEAERDDAERARAEAEEAAADAAALAAELRERMDTTLEELGKYRALTERADAADSRVEEMMSARIAELQQERDAAQAEAARLAEIASAGWWQRRRLLRAARQTTPINGGTA